MVTQGACPPESLCYHLRFHGYDYAETKNFRHEIRYVETAGTVFEGAADAVWDWAKDQGIAPDDGTRVNRWQDE